MLDSHKEQTLSARVAFATPLPTGLTKKNPSADNKAPSVQHPSHQRHRHRHHHDHYGTNHVRHAFNPPHHKSQFTPHRSQQHLLSSRTRYGTTPMTSSTTTMAMAVTPSSDQAKEALSSSGGAMLDGLDVDFVTPSVRISSKRKGGDVLDTTELLSIPEALLLTPKSARATLADAYPSVKDDLDDFADEAMLALGLLYERHLGEQSVHVALLGELPRAVDMDCASLWNEKELGWLAGSPVWAAAARVTAGVAEEYERARKVFGDVPWLAATATATTTTDDVDEAGTGTSEEGYQWACAVVDARAVYVSQAFPLVLAPVLHCLQMDTVWTTAAQMDEEERKKAERGNVDIAMSGVGMFFSRRRVSIIATSVIPVGGYVTPRGSGAQQQRQDGGSDDSEIMTNGQMLLEKGKAVKDERAYTVEIGFELASLDRFRDDKLNILSNVTLESSGGKDEVADDDGLATFTLRAASKRGLWTPPEAMDAFLRLLCLSSADAFLLEPVFSNEVWDFMQMPVSAENEKAACELVIGACEDALDAYVDDDDLMKDERKGSVSMRRKLLAGVVVQGEKIVLNAAKKHYERVLDSLDVLEYYAERRLKQLDLLRPLDESEIIDSESGAQVGRAFDDNYR